jgi:hypothetical protein
VFRCARTLTDDPQPEMWMSMWQVPIDYVSFAVRTSVNPEAMMGSIRNAVAASGDRIMMGVGFPPEAVSLFWTQVSSYPFE